MNLVAPTGATPLPKATAVLDRPAEPGRGSLTESATWRPITRTAAAGGVQ